MGQQQQVWWTAFVSELEQRPLAELVTAYGLTPAQGVQALVEAGTGGPVHEEPWWPEAVRVAQGHSLREAARLFSSNPRRIRRGLARQGLRVGGQDLAADGVQQLVPFRARLGHEPDHKIAQDAQVSIEAVQGERRRLGVAAFRPEPRPRPAPIALPVPEAALEAPPPEPEAPAPRAPRRTIVRAAPPRGLGQGVAPLRPEASAVPRPSAESLAVVRRPSVGERAWPASSPQAPRAAELHEPRREPAPAARAAEPPRGVEPSAEAADPGARRRERTGRTLIIRPDRPEADESVEPLAHARPARKPRSSPHGEVRELKVESVDLREIIAAVEDEVAAPRVVIPDLAPAPEAAPVLEAPPAPQAAPVPEAAPAPAAEPAAPQRAEPEAESVDRDQPPPPATIRGVLIPLFPERAPQPVLSGALAWQILVDGEAIPLVFLAADAGEAVRRAAVHLDAALMARASVVLVGPALGV